MKRLFSQKLWTALSVVFATILTLVIIVNSVVGSYYAQIDNFLGISERYTFVGADSNAVYFDKTPYVGLDSVQARSKEVCEAVEGEGLVLLKNENNALPLAKDSKVSLFGVDSTYINCSAQGQRKTDDKEMYPTLKEAFENAKTQVNGELWQFYQTSSYGGTLNTVNEIPWDVYPASVKSTFGSYGDAAIVLFARDSIEGSDVKANGTDEEIKSGKIGTDGTYISLSVDERQLLTELTKLKSAGTIQKIVVLLNSAVCISLDFLQDENISVDACMWIGNTGMSGINAVAKAVVGDIVPSGKLSDTYVYDNFSSPAMASWAFNDDRVFTNRWSDDSLGSAQSYYGVYVEGVYVGYRYYETRYADVVEGAEGVGEYKYTDTVAYPFGYGKSYTTFAYSDFSVKPTADGKAYDVSVKITNTDENGLGYSGKEVVQVYLQKPYTDYAREVMMEVPAIELVGFAKTSTLTPGSSETVTVRVDKQEFASYDTYGFGTYVVDSGEYFITVGNGAHDALNNVLANKGYSVADGMDYDGKAELVYKIDEAKQDHTTYATSGVTGNEIGNKLQAADPNTNVCVQDMITYVSRNDWDGTWPTEKAIIKLNDALKKALQNKDIADVKSEGDLPAYNEKNGLTLYDLRGKSYDDPMWTKLLNQMTFDDQNTLIHLAINTAGVASVTKPSTVESDGPTHVKDTTPGYVESNCRFPCEGIWASTFNTDLMTDVGEILASDCVLAGISGLWCSGVNIHRTPFGGRAHEYFSEDPFLTGNMVVNEIKALQHYGIVVGAKHYVFNDQERNRSGVATWLNEQSAREIYLEPWYYVAAPVENGGAACGSIMSSFNRMGPTWTSASKELITGILRDEFGFDGYVITDLASGNGASYMTALDGILAGTDCWLNYNVNEHSLEAYKDNATVALAMREACHRILYTIGNKSIAMNGIGPDTMMKPNVIWYEALVTAVLIVMACLTAVSVVMYALSKSGIWKKFVKTN